MHYTLCCSLIFFFSSLNTVVRYLVHINTLSHNRVLFQCGDVQPFRSVLTGRHLVCSQLSMAMKVFLHGSLYIYRSLDSLKSNFWGKGVMYFAFGQISSKSPLKSYTGLYQKTLFGFCQSEKYYLILIYTFNYEGCQLFVFSPVSKSLNFSFPYLSSIMFKKPLYTRLFIFTATQAKCLGPGEFSRSYRKGLRPGGVGNVLA